MLILNILKDRLQVYGQLMRVDKPIGTLLLLWPTLWALWLAGSGKPDACIVLIFMLGTFLMRSAGCVINDYADRKIDMHVSRTKQRPFARGVVTGKEALLLAATLAILSFLLVLPLNNLTLLLSIPAVVLAASYPFTKRFFPLPQVYLGLAFAFGIPMAFAAQSASVPLLAWQLFLAKALWTLGYDTAYAMVDKPDDLKIGIKTSAITFGRHDVTAIMICYVLFMVLMVGIGISSGLGLPYNLSLLCAAGLFVQQYRDIRGRIRERCFKAFLDNNRIGLVIFIGLAADFLLR